MNVSKCCVLVAIASVALLGGLIGCDSKPASMAPAGLEKWQSQFVMEVEPAGAVTPLGYLAAQVDDGVPDLAETPAESDPAGDTAEDSAADKRVVMTGVVGGILNPFGEDVTDFPWKDGEATFYLVDASIVEEFTAHAGDEGIDHDCPFCRREAQKHADSVISVSFLDEQGEPIAIDSRKLFGLSQGDRVTIRGKAQKVGEAVILVADDLYRVQPDAEEEAREEAQPEA